MILLPTIVSLMLLALALWAFNAARGVVVGVQEADMRELVKLGSSSIDRLWIQPRNHAVQGLSESPLLSRHLRGENVWPALEREWATAKRMLQGCAFVYYGLEDGTVHLYPPLELPAGFDPRVRPWYEAGIQSATGPAWSRPYVEVITGETIVSTTLPLTGPGGGRIGVFAVDVTLEGVKEILQGIDLPTGGTVYLLDKEGKPFVGTGEDHVSRGVLPGESERLFVEAGLPLSNGWKVAVVVPRESLAEKFARVRTPMVLSFVIVVSLAALILSWLVAGLVSRTRRLAAYFEDVTVHDAPIRRIFRSHDEFTFLNHQFNKVMAAARYSEDQKLAQERTYRHLLERAPIGFFRTRLDGSVMFVNDQCAELLGRSREELLSLSNISEVYVDPETRNSFLKELLTWQEVRDRRILFYRPSGEKMWVSLNAVLAPDREAEEYHIEGFITDVTKDVEERYALKRLAETDPLTGLSNRRSLETAAKTLSKRRVGLVLIDVDYFKSLNDTLGHDAGDLALKQIAEVGSAVLRRGDLFARLGGDEFAILLPEATEDDAANLARRLQTEISGRSLGVGVDFPLSVSIGVTSHPGGEASVDELLKEGDSALYEAKRAGRGCIRRRSGG